MNKKFILRAYIVLASMWSLWWLYRIGNQYDGIMLETVLINAVVPIPLYFAIRWILNAFN
tara:strand:+ start:300 stop:479 length:180 start_codon:yes stop_codon:yes gene_type:complete